MITFSLSEDQKKSIDSIITRVPKNEDELKRYFFKMEEILGFSDVRLYVHYPDASAIYNGIEINIEFELISSNFKKHKHDPSRCDLIVCWNNDDNISELSILELSTISKNWVKLKHKAIQKYMIRNMHGIRENESIEDVANEIKKLMDTFNFDRNEAFANYMGITKRSFNETYASAYRDPEFMGGKNICVKKDLDAKHLNLEIDLKGIVPVVICCDCNNKNECLYGLNVPIGYFIVFISDEEKPRRSNIQVLPLPDKSCLEFCTEPPFNPWDSIRYNRY